MGDIAPYLTELIVLRGIERIIAVAGGIVVCLMGYKLFRHGIDKGYEQLDIESKYFKIILSGTGPGRLFMALGAIIIMLSLVTGGGKVTTGGERVEISSPSHISEVDSTHGIKLKQGDIHTSSFTVYNKGNSEMQITVHSTVDLNSGTHIDSDWDGNLSFHEYDSVTFTPHGFIIHLGQNDTLKQ